MPDQSTQGQNLTPQEKQCVEQLEHWLQTEAKFYGRKDEDFLIIFVRGCKFNMEKAKKKMNMFYENRKRIPQWWTHRDVSDLEAIFQLRITTALTDTDPQLPTFAITKISRGGPNSVIFDKIMKMHTIVIEMLLRRDNCQKNGLVVLVDCTDYPLWVLSKLLSPTVVYNIIHGYYASTPVRLKAVHFTNFPFVGRAGWRFAKTLLPPKITDRIKFYGSDLSSLLGNLDIRLLPEEYGGQNGSLVKHEEAFLDEVQAFSNYVFDDNKYDPQ